MERAYFGRPMIIHGLHTALQPRPAGIHVAFNAITGQTTSHIEHAGLAEAGAVWRVYQGQKMLGCFDEEALRMQADPGRLKR